MCNCPSQQHFPFDARGSYVVLDADGHRLEEHEDVLDACGRMKTIDGDRVVRGVECVVIKIAERTGKLPRVREGAWMTLPRGFGE